MRDRFKSLYAFEGRGLICSNARFVPPKPFSRRQKGARPFCVGLLSNLNAGKGLYDFVALIREAKANNLAVRGLLAGPPTAPADMAAIDAAQRELGSALEYCGALYGSAKDEFYAGLDAFLFPTRYNVESYGLVLIEALAHGVPVIAYSRGCIPSYLAPPAGYSIPITGDFTRKALQQIESWLADPSGHMKAREAAHALGKRLHAAAECTFHELVSAIGANREAAASEIRT
jgi:glycosyltransferase involved in cell wall biosynthesis